MCKHTHTHVCVYIYTLGCSCRYSVSNCLCKAARHSIYRRHALKEAVLPRQCARVRAASCQLPHAAAYASHTAAYARILPHTITHAASSCLPVHI